jgi:hypothetical protein
MEYGVPVEIGCMFDLFMCCEISLVHVTSEPNTRKQRADSGELGKARSSGFITFDYCSAHSLFLFHSIVPPHTYHITSESGFSTIMGLCFRNALELV